MAAEENDAPQQVDTTRKIIDLIIRIGALFLLLGMCFRILEPFVTPIVWAIVMAIALEPLFKLLRNRLGGRTTLPAIIVTALMLAVLIVPSVSLMIAAGGGIKNLASQVKGGNLQIPPPPESVKSYPIVGSPLYDMWNDASTNIGDIANEYKEELIKIGERLLTLVASTGKGLLLLIISILISGILLAHSKRAANFGHAFFYRLAGRRGKQMALVAEVTIRNVARGILGVSFIQALLAGIGMFIAGVPLAGLWTLLALILSIIQIGMLPISLGVVIYAWMSMSTTAAILLTLWMAFVGVIDNILKPIMLGRGAPVPMVIVFLGAIGGFLYSGFIGLFTGAIILSLGYELFTAWVKEAPPEPLTAPGGPTLETPESQK
jgi:predicted PurR-regulated permease PerM